ncbi:MAG: nucleotide exchange factor GrpE [Clostridiaceae bacterium]|nr:nucleotide exchange factor GrpE [Clostridiaceae bacterium]
MFNEKNSDKTENKKIDHETEFSEETEIVEENKENTDDEKTQQDNDNKNEDQELKEKLKKKEEEYSTLFDRLQRLAAEYDNFRKRTQKEKERIYDDAVCDVVSNFLSVIDNLERALQASEAEESNGLKEGVKLVCRQTLDILEKLKVKPIEAVGKPFNPELHNAVMHIEDEELDDNVVAEEFQKGYIYKDEIVIRHSMVKVAN